MRTESILMGTVPRVNVLQLRRGTSDGGDELFNIEGLPTPDEMRAHSRHNLVSRRSISERSQSAWINGWTAVALTTLGGGGLVAAGYLAFCDSAFRSNPPPTEYDTHLQYAVSGTMGALSALCVAVGLRNACLCMRARRDEPVPISLQGAFARRDTRDAEVGTYDGI